ncbi:tRNA epoxyqueuosine(34) reductase QueG [Aliiglaciecola sp. CAU 1673]|uniref:tRNA epoxyqueuosine(34) reductase QueG n=1 Tax=Aliiglaciecola sp. CAU 1673 TaxID=3032595 RepID=UPI0023DA93C0|nr:tRNA epoxyqueuosine(34) reductase QueG [Aliiglaciecola sp. CAU 1673]MDF2180397.1 tRNA epoxyqueuosine(34) reductase QueG [Aliiglaciecola sp. CAU 1673]
MSQLSQQALQSLFENIKSWGKALGFQHVGVADVDLSIHEEKLQQWLDQGMHGEMQFMAEHGLKRARPAELLPGTLRVISVRMDYLPPDAGFAKTLKQPDLAYISRYALGRDYHKLMRNRLKKLGEQIQEAVKELDFRPFVDSAPVLEHALAEKAGIGWTGKHSLTLSREAGSWFFLGELFINLPLPVDTPQAEGCGSCSACITICPTQAIVAPYKVDARRCISYLTIELKGAIPEEFRPLIGNRIYGCDDCQLICPWNRYGQLTEEADFRARPALKDQPLLILFAWDEATFLKNTEGSAIRRIGFERWQRNIAVALGNAPYDEAIVTALKCAQATATPLVKEHIDWALVQQMAKHQQATVPIRLTQRLVRSIEKGLPRDA